MPDALPKATMPDETSAERTNASDSSINDAFDLAEAEYAGHQTADKAPKTEPTKEVATKDARYATKYLDTTGTLGISIPNFDS